MLQAGGNALWAVHGALTGNPGLTLATGVGCTLLLVQLWQIRRAGRER